MAFEPNLLCIVPPYSSTCPPAGAAALLAYLRANGCDDFGFLDLRLHAAAPGTLGYAPTYRPSGVFGESFVIDVPDLPLVLHVLAQHDRRAPLTDGLGDDWFVDYCIARGIHPHALATYLARTDRFLEHALGQVRDVRFVGFSTWTSNFLTTLMAASHLKRRRDAPFIVAGGPQVTESTSSAKLGLASGLFDAVALGEGEETLLALYAAFARDGRRTEQPVPGTLQIESATGAFASTPRALLKLKELPLPDFSDMAIGSYRSRSGGRELPYQLSRGCTDKCAFCSEWGFWQKYRLGSMATAVEHIAELVRRYGAEVIHFTDSLLNGTTARLREFAETMLARGVVVPWFGFMRAEIDADTAQLVRRAGCVQAFIGIESLSDETLAAMNKRRTEADNLRALRLFLEAGIRVVAGIIPGFPGDTRERFLRTARMLVALQERYPGLLETNTEPFILSPGQPMYRDVARLGLSVQPWPAALVDGAGRYAELAGQVGCTFTGPNQGVDRLGELRIAQTLLASRQYSWHADAPAAPLELELEHLFGDVFLATTTSTLGHPYSLLILQHEKEVYDRIRSAESLLADQRPFEPLTERAHYRSLWHKLEQDHAVCGARGRFAVRPSAAPERVDDDSALRVAPWIVARVIGGELLVVHARTKAVHRLRAGAAGWLRSMVTTARTRRELAAETARADLALDVDELVARGVLEVAHLAVAPKLAPRPAAAAPRSGPRRLPVIWQEEG